MLLHDFLANMRRRWYLILVGILLTGLAAGAAYQAAPATYETKASLLLLPPKSSVGTRGNPFLYLGGLDQALDVLSTRLNAEEVTKPIATAYPSLTLEIARDATTSGPILVIDATSSNGDDTTTVVNQLVALVPSTMSTLQDNLQIPAGSRITVMNLNIDREPIVDLKNKIRAVVAIGAVGLAGTILFTGLIDSLLAGRRRRKLGQPPAAEDVDAYPARPPRSVRSRAADDVVPGWGDPTAAEPVASAPTRSTTPDAARVVPSAAGRAVARPAKTSTESTDSPAASSPNAKTRAAKVRAAASRPAENRPAQTQAVETGTAGSGDDGSAEDWGWDLVGVGSDGNGERSAGTARRERDR